MGLFEKPVYKEIESPFVFIESKQDYKAVAFTIEAYGDIDDQIKYLYMTFSITDLSLWDNGEYDKMLQALKHTPGKRIRLRLKYKKNRLVGFEPVKESLIHCMNDPNFNAIELVVCGINDTTIQDR